MPRAQLATHAAAVQGWWLQQFMLRCVGASAEAQQEHDAQNTDCCSYQLLCNTVSTPLHGLGKSTADPFCTPSAIRPAPTPPTHTLRDAECNVMPAVGYRGAGCFCDAAVTAVTRVLLPACLPLPSVQRAPTAAAGSAAVCALMPLPQSAAAACLKLLVAACAHVLRTRTSPHRPHKPWPTLASSLTQLCNTPHPMKAPHPLFNTPAWLLVAGGLKRG